MQKKTLAVAASTLLLVTLLGGCNQTKDNNNGRERMNNGNFQGGEMQNGNENGGRGRGAMKCKEDDTACAAMQEKIQNGEMPTPPTGKNPTNTTTDTTATTTTETTTTAE